jgi:hypothetical protein
LQRRHALAVAGFVFPILAQLLRPFARFLFPSIAATPQAGDMEHFSALNDPRDDKNKKHALLAILFLVMAAVISGAEGWEAIESFGQEKLKWLRK